MALVRQRLGAHVLIAVAVCVGLAHAITLSANDNCYFPDAAPFLSTSVEGLTDLPRGWTKYWFLSVDRLAAVAVGLPGNYMTCSSESFTQNSIPAFTVGIPLGRDKFSANLPILGVIIVPRANPTQLQYYGRPSMGWTKLRDVSLSASPYEDWKGILPSQPEVNLAKRLFVYGLYKVVEVKIGTGTWTNVGSVDLPDGSMINVTLSHISGAEIIDNTLYISRRSNDVTRPGDIVVIDISASPLKYIKTIYVQYAPISLIGWSHSWGPSLYWVSNPQPRQIDLWYWDLAAHSGGPPTSISYPNASMDCLNLARAHGTQKYGQYALLTFTPCNENAALDYFVMLEIRASELSRTITSYLSSQTGTTTRYYAPSVAVDVKNGSPAVAVLGLRARPPGMNAVNGAVLATYGQMQQDFGTKLDTKLIEPPPKIADKSRFGVSNHTKARLTPIPPFCTVSNCGPDSAVPDCAHGTRCFYYTTWVCCQRTPFP